MSDITTAARRIALVLNGKRGQGGFCVFGVDGTGGYWYSERSYPALTENEVKMWVPDSRISQAEVQRKLEGEEG
jgi:hypothetical protein